MTSLAKEPNDLSRVACVGLRKSLLLNGFGNGNPQPLAAGDWEKDSGERFAVLYFDSSSTCERSAIMTGLSQTGNWVKTTLPFAFFQVALSRL